MAVSGQRGIRLQEALGADEKCCTAKCHNTLWGPGFPKAGGMVQGPQSDVSCNPGNTRSGGEEFQQSQPCLAKCVSPGSRDAAPKPTRIPYHLAVGQHQGFGTRVIRARRQQRAQGESASSTPEPEAASGHFSPGVTPPLGGGRPWPSCTCFLGGNRKEKGGVTGTN